MSVFRLKLLVISLMFVDHLTLLFGQLGYLPTSIYSSVRGLTRVVFVLVCLLLVNGFTHTKNPVRYLSRLVCFAAVSQLPFSLFLNNLTGTSTVTTLQFPLPPTLLLTSLLLACGLVWYYVCIPKSERNGFSVWMVLATYFSVIQLQIGGVTVLGNRLNVFYTLAIGLGGMLLIKHFKTHYKHWSWYAGLVAFLLSCNLFATHSDYGVKGVVLLCLLYLTHWSLPLQSLCILGFATYCHLNSWPISVAQCESFFGTCLVIPLWYCYNGTRGKFQLKWAFYWFYPLHLALLYGMILWLK